MDFAPTHVIEGKGEVIPVQLVDGVLYTRAEWESQTAADWEVVDGVLLFQGQVRDGYGWRAYAVTCECGNWSGEQCTWAGPASETVMIEFMPESLRESHRAAGNSGRYPNNGAERITVSRSCAEQIVRSDGEWASIL